MRNSSIYKWAQNNKTKVINGKNKEDKSINKHWIHSPDSLLKGHVVYLVKFLGSVEVEKPKGIEVVKGGIQKLKFNQQLKKSEGGCKTTKKVELTISVDGVSIEDPKKKETLHVYPLHRISYCADDKAEKRFFSFIAKEDSAETHTCFVFVSDKLAEEITLTIGQAFELAYKKFLETVGGEQNEREDILARVQSSNNNNTSTSSTSSSHFLCTKRLEALETENAEFKRRLSDIGKMKDLRELEEYCKHRGIGELDVVDKVNSESQNGGECDDDDDEQEEELISLDANANKLESYSLDDLNDDDFNPRAEDSDPFGMPSFAPRVNGQTPVHLTTKNFSLDELDPFK